MRGLRREAVVGVFLLEAAAPFPPQLVEEGASLLPAEAAGAAPPPVVRRRQVKYEVEYLRSQAPKAS